MRLSESDADIDPLKGQGAAVRLDLAVGTLAFSPDERWVVLGSWDGTARGGGHRARSGAPDG